MRDLDERLRRELHDRAGESHPSARLPAAMGAAVARRRRRGRLTAMTAVFVLAALAGSAFLLRGGEDDSTRVITGPNPPAGTPSTSTRGRCCPTFRRSSTPASRWSTRCTSLEGSGPWRLGR